MNSKLPASEQRFLRLLVLLLFLGHLKLFASSKHLQQVMRHTHQQPFRFDLSQAAQQKLPEAAYVFELGKDRLDNYFSFAEHLAPGFAAQFVPHPFLQGGVFWQSSFRSPIERLPLVRRHMQVNGSYERMSNRGLTVVAGISRDLIRQPSQVLFYLLQQRHQLFLVHPGLHYFGRYDYLGLSVNSELDVVRLLESLRPVVLHDPRVRVGEVALGFRSRNNLIGVNYSGGTTPKLLSALLLLQAVLSVFLLRCLSLFLSNGARLLLDVRLQLADPDQARLSLAQLCRQFITAFTLTVKLIFFIVYALCCRQQPLDFGGQFLLRFTHPGVTHGLPFGSISFDLGAIDRHMAQFHQASSAAQLQYLDEQLSQLWQMPLAKLGNAIVIWLLVAGQHSEAHIIIGCLLNLSRRHLANAVTVDQQLDHQYRMIRRASAAVAFLVYFQNSCQIKRLNHIANIKRQVVVSQPFPQIRWQQQHLTHVVRSKRFAHHRSLLI